MTNKCLAFSLQVIALLGFIPLAAHAELVMDKSVRSESVHTRLSPLLEQVVRPYGDSHSAQFPYLGGLKGKGTFTYYEGSNFGWIFDGNKYLSNIASFVPDATPVEDCKPDPAQHPPNLHCDQMRERHLVCHLFMFDSSLTLAAVSSLEINRDAERLVGKSLCQSVKAMSLAKEVPDAMLITLGYSDSAEPADPRNEPPEFVTTVLLRFSDEDGKLQVKQDDSCLGNPNTYASIGSARKALKRCKDKK